MIIILIIIISEAQQKSRGKASQRSGTELVYEAGTRTFQEENTVHLKAWTANHI
jgi:hypothetical protein